MNFVAEYVLGIAASWWVVPTLALFACIDGFFPPVPAESLITALASLSASGNTVPLWSIWAAGVIGAGCGDTVAFLLGRHIPIRSIPGLRRVVTVERLESAQRQLHKRGASYLLGARFIPVGRVVINMTAGASGFKYRKFLPISLIASVMWAGFAVVVGWGTGQIIQDSPIVAMIVGIVVGLVIGFVLDRVITSMQKRRQGK